MPCLNDNTVLELVEQRLGDAERAAALAHIERCPACRKLVAHIAQALLDTRPDTPADADEEPLIEVAPLPVQPGDNLGRFIALHPLGSGGMGVVYAAYDPDLDRRVAIKLLRPEQARNSGQLRDRLLREAQSLARLNHPAVVTVYDVGLFADQVFVAMEYVDGCTLAEWLARRPRRAWRGVLAMLVEAGQGLAAAHRAGLIHRDFKPDNVLVGHDGRVRVTDFGLARTTAPASAAGQPTPVSQLPLAATLTQTKTLVGTPTYMAPEQMSGKAVDHRADIFSFCVTAWECLYGQRPYSGDTLERLLEQRQREQLREPPKKNRIPARIREALTQGLRSDPSARPQSLSELLERLSADPRGRQLRLALVAFALVALSLLLWRPWHDEQPEQLCRGAAGHWQSVWNDAAGSQLAQAFAKTVAPYAHDMAQAVRQRLGRYGEKWQRMHTEACEATHLRGEQSARLLDQRMRCLNNELARVRALVDVFSHADEQVVRNAVQAVAGLPSVDECTQGAALVAAGAGSVPADQRERLEQQLGRARAQRAAGQYDQADKTAKGVLKRASGYGDSAYLAEAQLLLGTVTDKLGHIDQAVTLLEKAVNTALGCQRDDVAADAMTALIFVSGSRRADEAAGLRWGRLAAALLQRLNDPTRKAQLLTQRGIVKREAGHYAEAERDFVEALKLQQKRAADNPESAGVLTELATTLRYRGRWDQALERFEQAAKLQRATLSPHHPAVAATLSSSADLLWRMGQHSRALQYLERALTICRAAYGPEHLETAYVLNHLANVQATSGHAQRALELYQQASAIGAKTLGPHHPQVAMARSNVAMVQLMLGQNESALRLIGEVLTDLRAGLGQEHHYVSMALFIEGDALAKLGKIRQALQRYQRALAIDSKALGDEHRDLAEPLTGIGECSLRLGQARAAREKLQRAHELLDHHGALFYERGRTGFAFAQALWSTGDREQARQLVAELVQLYETRGYSQEYLPGYVTLAQLQRWQREHR